MRRILVLLMVVALGVLTPLPAIADSVSSAQTFSIQSPGTGATVRGVVTLTIVSDTPGNYYSSCGSRSNADLFVDGQFFAPTTTAECSGASWLMSLDTTGWPNGVHVLSVSNSDLDAQIGDGKDHHGPWPLTTLIFANDAPTADLTSPAYDMTVLDTFMLQAQASPDPAASQTISRIDFLLDGVVLGSDSSAPYQLSWNTRSTPNGTHHVNAVAYDGDGHPGTSMSRTVLVHNIKVTLRLQADHRPARAGSAVRLHVTATDSHGVPIGSLHLDLSQKKHVSNTWQNFQPLVTSAKGNAYWTVKSRPELRLPSHHQPLRL